LIHRATCRFWAAYHNLTPEARTQADKQFKLLKRDPRHPSLHFKAIGRIWSARVSRETRALAVRDGDDYVWFWIGGHREYERLVCDLQK
jgi:hypothetical protein